MDDATTLAFKDEQTLASLGKVVGPYVPERGFEFFDEHAPYILENIDMLIDCHLIDGVSFNECLEIA